MLVASRMGAHAQAPPGQIRYQISHQGRLGFAVANQEKQPRLTIDGKDVALAPAAEVKTKHGLQLYEADMPNAFGEEAAWDVLISL